MGRWGRAAAAAAGVLFVGNLAAWGVHAAQRRAVLKELAPLAAQLDSLEANVAADDAWLARNARIMEGYAQHQAYAQRLSLRGRRARTHGLLAEQYNAAVLRIPPPLYVGPRSTVPGRPHLPELPGRR